VDPREVFAPAVTLRAAAVILAHNHPSGDASPSRMDVELTRQIIEGGKVLGVQVLDHIVVGAGNYVSLRERGFFAGS
jgi:DNA repair protein RadC